MSQSDSLLMKEAEKQVRKIVAWHEGVSWVRSLPKNGSPKIVVATATNTRRIRQVLEKRFGKNPSVNGIPIVVDPEHRRF